MSALTRLAIATNGFRGGGGGKIVENVAVELEMAQVDVTLDSTDNQVTLDPRETVVLEDRNVDVEVCD